MSDSESDPAPTPLEDAISALTSKVGRRWRHSNHADELVDDELWAFEPAFFQNGETARRELRGVPDLVRRDVGHLPLVELAELAHEVVRMSSARAKGRVPTNVGYVAVGLATRAISTLNEIAVLLEHGFAFGARSRWRTLSEVLVVARVLERGDRHTATRFKEHRWVMLARARRQTADFDWEGDLPTPEVMTERLVKRFGTPFGDVYGWAAVVSSRRLDVERPRWWHLEKIAGVEEHRSRVQYAHHSVHGSDAFGLLGTVDVQSDAFHSGSSPQGVLEVAADSVRLFRMTTGAVLDNLLRFSGDRKLEIYRAIFDEHALNAELRLQWAVMAQSKSMRARWEAALSGSAEASRE